MLITTNLAEVKSLKFSDFCGDSSAEYAKAIDRTSNFMSALGFDRTTTNSVNNIIVELLMSHRLYTPTGFGHSATVELIFRPDDNPSLTVEAAGIIDKKQLSSLASIVASVEGRTSEELFDEREEIVWKKRKDSSTDMFTTSTLSILTIAGLARAPLSLAQGKDIFDGLSEFTLEAEIVPYAPRTPRPRGKRQAEVTQSSAPHPPA